MGVTPPGPEATPVEGSESSILLKQGFIYSLSSAAPVLVTLLVTPVLTRTIDAVQYGVVGVGLVVIQVGLVVLGFGLQEPLARHAILGDSGIAGARAILLKSLVPSMFLTALACLTAPFWTPVLFGTRFDPGYVYALLAAWLFSIIASFQGILRAQNRPVVLVVIGMVASLAAPTIGLSLVALGPRTGERYLLGMALGYAVALAIGIVDFLRGGKAAGHPGDLTDALRLGVAMVFHQSAVYLGSAVAVAVAGQRLGVDDAGRMQLTLYVATAPAVIAVALSNSWSPLIYRTEPERRQEVASRLVADVAKVVAVLCGGLIMLLPVVLALLMPPSYDPATLVTPATFACVGAMFFVAYLASVHLMMTVGKNRSLLVVVPVSIGVAAATLYLLPAHLTTMGLGFPVSTLVMAVGARVVLPRVTTVTWQLRGIVAPTLAVLVLAGLGLILPGSGWPLLLRVGLAAIVGLVGLRYLRSVLGPAATGS